MTGGPVLPLPAVSPRCPRLPRIHAPILPIPAVLQYPGPSVTLSGLHRRLSDQDRITRQNGDRRMRIGTSLSEPDGPQALDLLGDQLRTAVDDGFSSAWMSNIFGLDALTALAVAGGGVPGIEAMVIACPVKREFAMTRRSAPSSSRTLERMRLAMKNATSSARSMPTACALPIRIATLVSSSGGSMATVSPQPKRDLSRSSSPSTSRG